MDAAAVASFLARGRCITGRRSACPAPHCLLCPIPARPPFEHRARADAFPLPLFLAQHCPAPFALLLFVCTQDTETPLPLCFSPESSSPAKSPATVVTPQVFRPCLMC